MAEDGLWGPCGIRLGSTGVGNVGMIHLVSTFRMDGMTMPMSAIRPLLAGPAG